MTTLGLPYQLQHRLSLQSQQSQRRYQSVSQSFLLVWPCQYLCVEICNILIKKGCNHQHNDGVVRSVVKVGRKTWSDLTHTLINRLKNRNFFQNHKLVSSISIWDQQQKYQSKCSHYQGKLNHIWEKYERFYKFVFVLNFRPIRAEWYSLQSLPFPARAVFI